MKYANRVELSGRLLPPMIDISMNLCDAFRMRLLIEDGYSSDNTYPIYITNHTKEDMKKLVNQNILVHGHITTYRGTRIIVDNISLVYGND